MSEPTNLDAALNELRRLEGEQRDHDIRVTSRMEIARTLAAFLAAGASAFIAGGVVAPLIGWLFSHPTADLGLVLVTAIVCLVIAALLYFWAEFAVVAATQATEGAA